MKHILFYFLLSICWVQNCSAQIETLEGARERLHQAELLIQSQSNEEAKPLLEQTVLFYRENEHPLLLGKSLKLLGMVYYRNHDYGTALDYLKEAEVVLIKESALDELGEVMLLLSSTHANLDHRIIAIDFAKEAVYYAQQSNNFDEYLEAASNLSLMYYRYQEYDSAVYFANLVIDNSDKEDTKKLADAYTTLHGVHRLKRDYPKAIKYAKKALEYCIAFYGERHPYTGYAEYYLGWTYRNMGQWAQALPHLQRALIYNHESFSDTSIFSFPNSNGILHLDYEMGFLDFKGECLEQMYLQTKNLRYLTASLKNYQLAVDLMDTLRNKYNNPETLLIHNSINAPIYLRAVSVLEKLYQLEKDEKLLNQAFHYAEEVKAFWLNRMLLLHRDMQTEKDTTSLVYQYLQKRKEVQEFEKIANQRKQQNFQLLNQKKEEQEHLLEQLKQQNPAYYQQYFEQEPLDVKALQESLPNKTAMISFVALEHEVLMQLITKDGQQMASWAVADSLQRTIKTFVKSITKKETATYLRLGEELYQRLIAPLNIPSEIEHIFLATYGPLSYFPFESLLTQKVSEQEVIDYSQLPYWGMEKTVSYVASATTWKQQCELPAASETYLLGFAPQFSGEYSKLRRPNHSRKQKLSNLKGNLQELEKLEKLFPGTFFRAAAANKAAFLQHAAKANVIHLATHGLVEYFQPAYSAIAFSAETPDSNMFLYAYELYGMDLNADLVVLSACNTAMGRYKHGEGAMSLAHAFTAAGSKSVVMSLWEVADLSAPKIMGYFYEYLKAGDNKALALQTAKHRYIEESDANGAHPYYWAALTLSGDVAPLAAPASSFSYGWAALAALPLLALSGLWWYRKRARATA